MIRGDQDLTEDDVKVVLVSSVRSPIVYPAFIAFTFHFDSVFNIKNRTRHFSVFLFISQHFSALSAFLYISLNFSEFLCISLHLSEFLCISRHFSAFFFTSLHFSTFLCILHFIF